MLLGETKHNSYGNAELKKQKYKKAFPLRLYLNIDPISDHDKKKSVNKPFYLYILFTGYIAQC